MKKATQIFRYINIGRREKDRSGRCLVIRWSKSKNEWRPQFILHLN